MKISWNQTTSCNWFDKTFLSLISLFISEFFLWLCSSSVVNLAIWPECSSDCDNTWKHDNSIKYYFWWLFDSLIIEFFLRVIFMIEWEIQSKCGSTSKYQISSLDEIADLRIYSRTSLKLTFRALITRRGINSLSQLNLLNLI